jgi:two-component system CheB/CheR fusion protein
MAPKHEKNQKPRKKPSAESQSKAVKVREANAFPIVGIGSSAGGLEALEGFFAHVPQGLNAAFVVIQHMDPHRKSLLGELLKPYSRLAITEIEDGQRPARGCIYINPPNYRVSLFDRTFCLFKADRSQAKGLPIDLFLRSLADDLKEQAIAVILSGTGTDGTLGIKAVKEHGGLVMVQEEAQAAYSGMPASAIGTGLADFVLPIENMGAELQRYLEHPYLSTEALPPPDDAFQTHVKKILFLVRSSTGNDFSGYKQNTIRRRIERRMALHQLDRIHDYLRFVEQNPAEIDTLLKDLLIGVTSFFRDPKAFEALAAKGLAALLQSKPSRSALRVWVPGCATGEEAYSLVMLIIEAMDSQKVHLDVQIFATDIDKDAILIARQGIYTDSIAADVSSERLKRFFVRHDKTFSVQKQVREMVVFAPHNLIKDPPFSKLDLVSCRNLMIYMEPELQKKILPLFHFTLGPDGVLFLGSSESIGKFTDLFTPLDNKWKIYRRREAVPERVVNYAVPSLADSREAHAAAGDSKRPQPLSARLMAEKIILEHFAPPSVLINEKFNILYFMGNTNPFLRHQTGEPSVNLLKLIDRNLHALLRRMVTTAIHEGKPMVTAGVPFKLNDQAKALTITVTPLDDPAIPPGLLMVVFETTGPMDTQPALAADSPRHSGGNQADPRIQNLEQELRYTRENLQTTIEELETSNEELRSAIEELQSTNEELQSSNEELETSKEEMHSTNEELVTVNAELQNKVRELEGVHNDINMLLASTQIATLFLDADLRIKRFTPAATRLFNLIDSDIGRPIGDITAKVTYDDFQKDAREVLATLAPIERELATSDGRVMTSHVLPYRTADNRIDGIVATFMDMTARVAALEKARGAHGLADSMVNALPEPLVMLDEDLKVLAANRAFLTLFQLDFSDIREQPFYRLAGGFWGHAGLKQRLRRLAVKGGSFARFSLEGKIPGDGAKKVFITGTRAVTQEAGHPIRILLAMTEGP